MKNLADDNSKLLMYYEYIMWFSNLNYEYQVENHILSFEEFIIDGNEKIHIDKCKSRLYNKEK